MTDTVRVEVVEGVESLAHDEGSLCLSQVLPFGDVEEELAAFAKPARRIHLRLQPILIILLTL